ncbi:acetyl-CoA carboxylase biotin carboxyl carrier protein subunit, partial [Klebsiella pneumoniae]|uniref:acetyl-CoA carboxylase biotin carboxyl carrier protein subunit n=1 Tax=Klebsiella pneumoniae TaxID=573 RepID=UPI00292A5B24
SQAAKRPPVVNYPGEGFREMTKAQWAALPRDCKAVRSVEEAEAMKMKMPVASPEAGVLKSLAVNAGDRVNPGMVLFEIAAE